MQLGWTSLWYIEHTQLKFKIAKQNKAKIPRFMLF